jgi:hypothetical protein
VCSLVLHMRGKQRCVQGRMKWQGTKYLINKSYTQIRQCKWLMKVKLTLHHGFVLDSLLFSLFAFGRKPCLPMICFGALYEDYIEMNFFSRFSNGSFRIIKLWVLWFFKLIFLHMSFNWRVSNYKIVTFYDIFPMLSCMLQLSHLSLFFFGF